MSIHNVEAMMANDPTKNINSQSLLKLMITTMVNQDPFESISNENFMLQIAQMEAAQRSQEMAKEIGEFNSRQKSLAARDYVGDQVQVRDGDEWVVGQVTEAKTQEGQVKVNGKYYDVDSIDRVLFSNHGSSVLQQKSSF